MLPDRAKPEAHAILNERRAFVDQHWKQVVSGSKLSIINYRALVDESFHGTRKYETGDQSACNASFANCTMPKIPPSRAGSLWETMGQLHHHGVGGVRL